MKKRTVIVLCASGGLILGAFVLLCICIGSSDFSSKISYLQNSFEVEKPYFSSCPTDEELKKLFEEHKKDFHQLAIMAYEDKVSQFRKNWIFHNDSSCSMVIYPYILGEFPSDKIISRDRFFKYLELMKRCKIQDIGNDFESEDKNDNNHDKVKSVSKGLRFFIFEDYKYDDVPQDKFLAVNKHIYFSENDDRIKFVPDTDVIKESDKNSNMAKTAFAKLEDHWMIEKSISLENNDLNKDENDGE